MEVRAGHLEWDRHQLMPGEPILGRARWSIDGASMVEAPAVGDLVSLHWDWVCDVITPDQAAQIDNFETRQREALGLT